jgi:peroxiredoxin
LPSFVANSNEFYNNKGVTDIFCLSVNDKYVMKSWAEATAGCVESNIKMVADGNAEYTQALGLTKDGTGSRMGLRSKRYAAVIEYGVVKLINVDEKGMTLSSADAVLSSI